MKTKILAILTALTMFFAISCESPTNDDGKKDEKNVSFTGLTADGSADLTTNKLNLTFDKDIDGLALADITLNSNNTGAEKDNLTRIATGKYELSLKSITASGAVSVSVAKSSYTITGQPKQVSIFYKQGSNPPNPGKNGDIPAELVAKWYTTQTAADAGTGVVTLEFTSDGKLLYMGQDNNLTITVENNVITNYRSGTKIGTVKYTISGTKLNFSEKTGEEVVSTSLSFYKKAEKPIVVDVDVAFSELTADGSATKTTTFLTIKLDKAIPDFTVNDINLTVGATGAQKGALTPVNSNGTYKLELTNIAATGNITVSITKTGYAVTGSPQQVTVYLGDEVTTGTFGDFEYEYGSLSKKVTITKFLKALYTVTSITVPDKINGMDVVALKDGSVNTDIYRYTGVFGDYKWNSSPPGNTTITTITLPDSITYIGDAAFAGLSNLTTINLPNNLTHIGNYAFYYNLSLTTINVPQGITYIGNGAFGVCRLIAFDIPNGVTYLGEYAFDGNKLTQVNIPPGITRLEKWVFSNNREEYNGIIDFDKSLTYVFIPNHITYLAGFSGCPLYSINIPNSVTTIGGGAFSCKWLTNKKISIPSNVQYIENEAFYDAEHLEEIEILGDDVTVRYFGFVCTSNLGGWDGFAALVKIKLGNNIEFIQQHPSDPSFDSFTLKGFIDVYNQNGKTGGTYDYNGTTWIKQ